MNLKYIITGTPRSSTRYMAELFTSAGIHTSHELIFGMPGLYHLPESQDLLTAESSWLAVPLLQNYLNSIKIHVVRNPIDVISSMKSRNFLEMKESNIYTYYVIHCMPTIENYEGLDKYIYFWVNWNEHAEHWIDKAHRVEDITKNPVKFFESIGVHVPNKANLYKGRSNVYESRGRNISISNFRKCELYKDLVSKANEYGYKLK